jgi:hypothetical protein
MVLSSNKHCHERQQDKEAERLASLAAWLQRKGHLLTGLCLQLNRWQNRTPINSTIPAMVEALAAAGSQPGGLRLQRLSLPSLGCTPLSTVCSTLLPVCCQLKELVLGYASGGACLTHTTTKQQLAAALRQLTQLTSLTLDGCVLSHKLRGPKKERLDYLITRLPSSLQVLDLGGVRHRRVRQLLSLGSLRRLAALQQLALPGDCDIITCPAPSRGPRGAAAAAACPLAALTALMRLQYTHALAVEVGEPGHSLLARPNLADLSAGYPSDTGMQLLLAKTTLRSLSFKGRLEQGHAHGPILAQLSRLTSLHLHLVGDSDGHQEDWSAWCGAVESLTGLRHLSFYGDVLRHLNLAPFTTNLTHLNVDVTQQGPARGTRFPPITLVALMGRLVPLAGGALREVRVGVLRCANWRQEVRDAVVAAVGDEVEVVIT